MDPMQQINEVYKCCKFGRFHVKLLVVSFVGTVASILVTNTNAYLLPTAECDLNMNLLQKGLLNAMPFLGMMVPSIIAGFLTDTFGRKFFLKLGFAGMFLCELIAGTSQTYEMLITAKFFEGLFFAVSISALTTLTSEFCHKDIRDRVMLCQSSFAAVTQILAPAMAWGVLMRDWRYSFFNGYIVLNTWNFYLYAMSLWSLAAFIMYVYLPESPKYLITKKEYSQAKEILLRMYIENTGKPNSTFPFTDLWISEEKGTARDDKPMQSITDQIVVGLKDVKVLFRKPLLLYLIMLSFMCFLTMGKYNVLRLWFPQMSTIVEHYDITNSDLCLLLDRYTADLREKINSTVSDVCVPKKSGTETYVNSIIIGFVCILPYFISGALVNTVGKKLLLIASSLICVAATLGLRWADTKTTVVALFSLDIAVSQCIKGLIQTQAVGCFPTNVRTLAMSIIMTSARVGTLFANIWFPVLLDTGCVIVFFTLAGTMVCLTITSIMLPKNKGE